MVQNESNGYSTKPNLLLAVLGLIGFGISLYALVLHIQSKMSGGALGCDMNDLVNCTKVLAGDYGSLLGIPLGGYGMAYFAILIAASFLPKISKASAAYHARLQLFVSLIGAVVSVGLASLSFFVIKSTCLVCSSVHATCVVAFLVAVFFFVKVKDKSVFTDGNVMMKFISTSLAVSVPALLAGFAAPLIVPQVMTGSEPKKEAALDMKKQPVSETILTVSKSRFVGKGEDFRKGNDDAKVVIQMFSDFQCPHCKQTAESILAAMKKVGEDKVLYVYRNYPLSNICNSGMGGVGHSKSCLFAQIARCGGQQGKFWELKDWAFGTMGASETQLEQITAPDAIAKKVQELGIDKTTFDSCMKSDADLNKIRDDVRIGNELGIKGTPLLVVNNRVYDGPRSPDDLVMLFQNLLAAQ
jgi:protein-disulfide isomerase